LGFDDYIPPYVTASGQDILKGVNYASAAAGIREETGQQLVRVLNFALSLSLANIITSSKVARSGNSYSHVEI
jgi:hypothetical protein